MPLKQSKSIFTYALNFSGLAIEITSDDRQLIKLDFIKEKKIPATGKTALPGPVKKTIEFLDCYFNGTESGIKIFFNTKLSDSKFAAGDNKIVLDMTGYSEKEISVYRELLKIKPGETISYSGLAIKSGIPKGARFAGNCMASNRFPVIVPCHRVIKKDGSIGNYTGGTGIKEFLLKHEKENF